MPSKANQPRYSVVIQWSEEDQCYVVSLPEWGSFAKTHGDTYEEAARNALEVLELLLDEEEATRIPPTPRLFHYPGADIVDLPSESDAAEVPSADGAEIRQTA